MAALTVMLLAAACATQQRDPSEDQAVKAKAGEQVRRICKLPEAERQAEIDKIKAETGLALLCAK